MKNILLALAILMPGLSAESRAELITFTFAGEIDTITDATGFLVGTGLDTTDTFSGTFTYNTATVLSPNPFSANVGDGSNLGDVSVTLHSGEIDYTGFVTGTMAAQKHDDNAPTFNDALFITGNQATFPPALAGTFTQNTPTPNTLQVAFRDDTSAAFSDFTSLPSSLDLSPGGLLSGTILFTAFLGDETGFLGNYQIKGPITSISFPGQAVAGDLDGDGFVGIGDLNIVLGNWNQAVPPGDPLADPSGDGFVGIDDLNEVLGNWNAGTPPPPEVLSSVPEPGTLVMLGVGVLFVSRVRRHGC
jgi:PEP-CTERM motif-containing protein